MRIAITILLLLVAGTVSAQPYGMVWLVPATDTGYDPTCLFIDDDATDLCSVVVLVAVGGSYVALDNFRVSISNVTWTYLADLSDYTVIGNSQSGASVSFGQCLPGPFIPAMTIRYLCQGRSPCGQLSLVAGPLGGSIQLVDCADVASHATGSQLTVNGIFDVPPGGFDPDCGCWAVPVEHDTWGAIKALYQ
jgi:hypothetical protein